MNCSRASGLEGLAAAFVQGARMELHLTPKPGLVDLDDCGAHSDLSLAIMERSIALVADCLAEIVGSLRAGEPFAAQQAIGLRAERRLADELGTNTHKGFIFLAGMLLVARWQVPTQDEQALRAALAECAAQFFCAAGETPTNGRRVRDKYQVGGIVREALAGFPALFEQAIPAFRAAIRRHGCPRTASFAMLARLMQTVEDTTALHRAGPAGLQRIRRDGAQLEQIMRRGGNHVAFLRRVNRSYIRLHLTMGGVADVLGLACGLLMANGEMPPV